MNMLSRSLFLASSLVLGSCATVGTPAACAFSVDSNLPEAMVLVDDVALGRASEWAGPGRFIQPGFHRVELRHPEHYSSFSEIDCPSGTTSVVKAQLRRVVE